MAKDDESLLELARKRFKLATDAFSETRQLQREDQRFALGSPDNDWQWNTDDVKARGNRPLLTINKLPLHITQVTNDARQNRPAIKIRPVDDKADVETAEVFNGVIRHIESNSDSDTAYDMAIDNSATHGEGYIRVLTDFLDDESFDQEIYIKPVSDSFAVTPDPAAITPEASDAEFWFVEDWYSDDEFKKKWPKAEAINWDFDTKGESMAPWFREGKVCVAEYWHKQDYSYDLNLWADGTVTVGSEGRPAVERPQRTRRVNTKKIYCCVLSPKQVLEKKEWAGKYFPFARVAGNLARVEGKIIQSGIVRNAKDAQRMYNYWSSQEAEFLGKWTKIPYTGPAEAFEGYEDRWKNANVSDDAFLPFNHVDDNGNPIPAPQRVQPPVAPSGMLQAKLGASEDIKATTGQFDASLGQKSNETSGRAILARQREGDTATFHYIDNLSKAIRQIGRILVDLIPKIYDTERVARVLGEDGEAKPVRLNPEQPESVTQVADERGEIQKIYNLGVGQYDVVSTVGPSFTTKRQEAVEAMTAMVQGNPSLWQLIGDLLVSAQDWPGADEMAKRLRATVPANVLGADAEEIPPQAKAALEQMQQGMEQAAQLIEQLKAENQQLKEGSLTELAKLEKKGDIDAYLKLLDISKDVLLQSQQPNTIDLLPAVMQRLDEIAQTLAAGNAKQLEEPQSIDFSPMPEEQPAMEQQPEMEAAPEEAQSF